MRMELPRKRARGRPRRNLMGVVRKDMRAVGVREGVLKIAIDDGKGWHAVTTPDETKGGGRGGGEGGKRRMNNSTKAMEGTVEDACYLLLSFS